MWMKLFLKTSFFILVLLTTAGALKASAVVSVLQKDRKLVVARMLSSDVFVQRENYSQLYNRYSYAFNNPLRYTDPSGWLIIEYRDRHHNLLTKTADGRDDIMYVSDDRLDEFKKHLKYSDENRKNSEAWNDYWRDEFRGVEPVVSLSDQQMNLFNSLHSDKARAAYIEHLHKPSVSSFLSFSVNEVLGQWTTPELVIGGLSAGVSGLSAVRNVGTVAKTVKGAKGGANVVDDVAKQAKSWLGKDYKIVTNKAGDNIFMPKDGLRKMRFDIKNPHRDSPHIHVEKFINGKWSDAIPDTHRIYPQP